MATIDDELAALKDMLDSQVIDAAEYEDMSRKARARHGVREPQQFATASQRQTAPNMGPSAQSGQAAKDAAGTASSTVSPGFNTTDQGLTWDQLVENVGTGVAGVVTGQGAKSKYVAALLALFLGPLGIHKFYLGYAKEGVITFFITFFGMFFLFLGPMVMGVISFIEFIIYLTKSPEDFQRTYVEGRRGFF